MDLLSPPALLAAIASLSDEALLSRDLQGAITSWSEGAERLFGYRAGEVLGRSTSILAPLDRAEDEDKLLRRVARGEKVERHETVCRRKDDTYVDVSLNAAPVLDEAGAIVGEVRLVRDISSRRQTLDRLRRSEERFRTTLASIGDAVIATDRQGMVTFLNPVAEALTGRSRAEALGMPVEQCFRIVNEVTRRPVENPVSRVLREGIVVGLANHTVLIAKDGTERPIDDSGAPIREGGGEIAGAVLVFRDVTERRQAEITALRLAAIIESSDDAILSKDLTGTIMSWNAGARRIFGYEEREIVGRSIRTLIPAGLQKEEDEILARLRRGERVEHFDTVRIAKDGREVAVSLTISPIKDGEGNIVGASKIARDVTERKRIEQTLREARRQLEAHSAELERRVRERTVQLGRTVAELEAFSYSLSHDLRSPLRTIIGFSQIVLDDHGRNLGPEGTRMVERIGAAAGRMDRLIMDLLTFTRLSNEPVVLKKIDPERLIRDIVSERPEWQPPRVEVEIAGPLPPVRGNEASLTQCFTNLLDNAAKFVAAGVVPRVRIRAEPREGRVRLWFEDNGIGIGPGEGEKLFQMFHRLHTEEYPGTGIGLAIVRKAAERLGGEAGFESEPGKGSRFWVELPADRPAGDPA